MKRLTGVVSRGVVAGILGAVAMAFWFLLIDGSQGEPFHTPAFLASALLGRESVNVTFGLVVLYTAIHFAAFVGVGVLVSWLMSKISAVPSVLLGLVLGFALFDIVFYLSVTITGVDVVAEIGWPAVLAGNLIAGVVLMGFLHLTGATRPVTWWEVAAEHRVVREGVVAGLIGAVVVALWFLIFDLMGGRPFFTPAALGSALFLGASGLDAVSITFVTVAGYTIVHVSAFVVTGFIVSAIAVEAEEAPALVIGAVMLFVAFEAFFMGLLAMVAEFLLGALAWWTIAVGNVLAAVTMGWYIWMKHPKLRAALAEDPLDRTD